MLILSRKVGQKIMIGDGITVVVSRVAGERVTLGLEAPANVRILRGELRPFEHDPRGARDASPDKKQTARFDRQFGACKPARPR